MVNFLEEKIVIYMCVFIQTGRQGSLDFVQLNLLASVQDQDFL